ncbi:hypothetical protein Taro_017049 [Colocasia esculenta]|uniref:Uncharacterized protein n=1 Tax=Colocasia esculenta TaxID=4460 RepID=A0A843UMJ7_COLES|nr:hypothetical protein [Colocasia esculenta]
MNRRESIVNVNRRASRVQMRASGYNRLIDHVGIHDQRRLTEALCKSSLVRRKEYPTESSPQAKKSVYIKQVLDVLEEF